MKLIVFDKAVSTKLRLVIIYGCKEAAHKPAGGIAQGNRNNLVTNSSHAEQIQLPEQHKGGKHDNHGSSAVASAAQSAGINLVKAAKKIKRR